MRPLCQNDKEAFHLTKLPMSKEKQPLIIVTHRLGCVIEEFKSPSIRVSIVPQLHHLKFALKAALNMLQYFLRQLILLVQYQDVDLHDKLFL